MPDGGFKGMTPDPDSEPMGRQGAGCQVIECERCRGRVYPGDWPFCRPDHPEDHER